jgi:hypothetical protein
MTQNEILKAAIEAADFNEYKGLMVATDDGNVFFLNAAGRNAAANYAKSQKAACYVVDNSKEEPTIELVPGNKIDALQISQFTAKEAVTNEAATEETEEGDKEPIVTETATEETEEGDKEPVVTETAADETKDAPNQEADNKYLLSLIEIASLGELEQFKKEATDTTILEAIEKRVQALAESK